ncbi:hypothetical protein TNIN_228721 [Trichonephila inaurata madagascariensis]|uniref:Uncharacterized protein n=1 Tax=Trichonephila inaurata madagascariensis TaxID=2747483 RepID=A0A8X6XLX6_9ARAC|nr:hypothetical protein TNIN_228721 [Trichonephila inaurata madagascariensis]
MPGKTKNKLSKHEKYLRHKNIAIDWVRNNLKEIIKGDVDHETALYMASVLDYAIAEVVEVSNEIANARHSPSGVIEVEDIKGTLDLDLELHQLFENLYDNI